MGRGLFQVGLEYRQGRGKKWGSFSPPLPCNNCDTSEVGLLCGLHLRLTRPPSPTQH